MRYFLGVLTLLLVGCGEYPQSGSQQVEQDKYRIILQHPHGMPSVWTTPNVPYPIGAGWAFHLRDRRLVMISGTVTIEER